MLQSRCYCGDLQFLNKFLPKKDHASNSTIRQIQENYFGLILGGNKTFGIDFCPRCGGKCLIDFYNEAINPSPEICSCGLYESLIFDEKEDFHISENNDFYYILLPDESGLFLNYCIACGKKSKLSKPADPSEVIVPDQQEYHSVKMKAESAASFNKLCQILGNPDHVFDNKTQEQYFKASNELMPEHLKIIQLSFSYDEKVQSFSLSGMLFQDDSFFLQYSLKPSESFLSRTNS
jgi:hypothetical protein